MIQYPASIGLPKLEIYELFKLYKLFFLIYFLTADEPFLKHLIN